MDTIDARREEKAPDRQSWTKRLGWLLLLWLMGVGALWLLALIIRSLMDWAGMRVS